MPLFPDNSQLLMEVHRIENGYLLVVARTNGSPAIIHCEHEAAVGERIIALSTEAKLKGEQLELPLVGGGMTTAAGTSTNISSRQLASEISELPKDVNAQ